MSQLTFGEKVKEYLKAAGYNQKILANALGLDRTVLTHKLNATGRTVLTHPEIKQLVKTLAELGAITNEREVLELLAEVNCPGFTREEWQARPLNELDRGSSFAGGSGNRSGVANYERAQAKTVLINSTSTLTFLFTDIEGSTERWERYPQAMKLALARHDKLLRQAIETNGGQVFKTVGDGFYTAFPSAPQAVTAALTIQRILLAEKWDEELGPIKVRTALYTGTAETRDGDYFGKPLNRLARLLAAGHDGQILLPEVTAQLVKNELPSNMRLKELGEYQFKDLLEPERVYQLVAPGLQAEFGALRNLVSSYSNQMPNPGPSFGRGEGQIGHSQHYVKEKPLPHQLLLMYRQRTGLTQTRLAQVLGLKSDRMIQLWEGGYSIPPASRLKKLIELYLHQGIFIVGQERQEAAQLWHSIKEMFDTNSPNFETYPIFDEKAFEALLVGKTELSDEANNPFSPNLPSATYLQYFSSTGSSLDSTFSSPSNLPTPLSSFIGREREVAAISDLLRNEEIRLVTLYGPGGIGKTRLALKVASVLKNEFEAGVFFVELTDISEGKLLLGAIAEVLKVSETGGRSLMENLVGYLRRGKVLLVLDNFEQLASAGPVVAQLLEAVTSLKVLVTSRIVLRMRGEVEYAVEPLELPDPKSLPSLDSLNHSEAIRLFVDRTRHLKPDFTLTTETAMAVVGICQQLDGLPLAIELAAARSRLLTPHAMLARLGNRLKLLSGGLADLPPRQRTLRATVAWSFDLLTKTEQKLFARLCVFSGGFTLEAAEQIGALETEEDLDVLEGLDALASKSFVRMTYPGEKLTGAEPRYFILETIREYGIEKLKEWEELDSLKKRHAHYFFGLARAAAPELRSQRQLSWLEILDKENNNTRAALEWSFQTEPLLGAKLTAALSWYWVLRGYLSESQSWLAKALVHKEMLNPALYSELLKVEATLAHFATDYTLVIKLFEQSRKLSGEVESLWSNAYSLSLEGMAATHLGQKEVGLNLLNQGLVLAHRQKSKWDLSFSLYISSVVAYMAGNGQEGQEFATESQQLALEIGDKWILQYTLLMGGHFAYRRFEYSQAKQLYEAALEQARVIGTKQALAAGLEGLAWVACGEQDLERAVRLWGATASVQEAYSCPLPPMLQNQHQILEIWVLAEIGNEKFNELWNEGHELPLEEGIKLGLRA